MGKSKKLNPEQKQFLTQFVVSRKQKEKLSTEYKDFLRRKTKVLGEVYKLAPENALRKTLEDQIAQIDAGKVRDKAANFKGAYEELEAIKKQARRAAKGRPALTAAEVERQIQHLWRTGFGLAREVKDVIDGMEAMCAELRKDENKASSRDNLVQATHFRTDFAGKEDEFRTNLLTLANSKNAVGKALADIPLERKTQQIRSELEFLRENGATGLDHLPALLDQALVHFRRNNAAMTAQSIGREFDVKVTAFEELIVICKDLSKFKNDTAPQPLGEKFKELVEKDNERVKTTKMLLLEERLIDEWEYDKTEEKPRQVTAPYQWSQQMPEYRDFTDLLPERPEDFTPQKTEECKTASRQMIQNLLANNANNPDLVFDLSIQTQQTLEQSILDGFGLDIQPNVPANLTQAMNEIGQQAGGRGTPQFLVYKKYIAAKQILQADGDLRKFAIRIKDVLKDCRKKLDNATWANDAKNTAARARIQALVDAIAPEVEMMSTAQTFAEQVATEMANAITEHCPNTVTQQKQTVQVRMPDGTMGPVDAPTTLSFNGQQYNIVRGLGAGTNGATFRYENNQGRSVVVKAFMDQSEEGKTKFSQEMKMHKHLMGGDDEGKDLVLKLEGSARGPDGAMYMIMEEAGGGGLDKLGDNIRALGSTGILSQQAQNAITQHFVRQAIAGLKYLQDRNMTHHDIKADNFFLSNNGSLKLADFGSSQVSDNPEGEVLGPAINAELEGAPAFKSPEFDDKSTRVLTGKSDTFTLGVMIAKLTSPVDSRDRDTNVGVGDFRSTSTLNAKVGQPQKYRSALDRMKDAMLDPDPTKRPTLEAIEYSTYLDQEQDPELVQALVEASFAYSQLVGREVGNKRFAIHGLEGGMLSAEKLCVPSTDAALRQSLQGRENRAELIRINLDLATAEINRIRNDLKDREADEKAAQNLDPAQRQIQIELCWNSREGLLKSPAANAMKLAKEAERCYTLANLNDDALRREIENFMPIVQREYDTLVKLLKGRADALRREIAEINNRDNVKPLVNQIKQAQDALLRGPTDKPEQTVSTQAETQSKFLERFQRVHDIAKTVFRRSDDQDHNLPIAQRLLERARDFAELDDFTRANQTLDKLEKDMQQVGGINYFIRQLEETEEQLKDAPLDDAEKQKLGKLLKDAQDLTDAQQIEQAFNRLRPIMQRLRDLKIRAGVGGRKQE